MARRISVVAGLGNPGDRYAGTRHNVGFDVVDLVAGRSTGGPWREHEGASVWKGRGPDGGDVVMVKPQTFMNLSGEPLGRVLRFFKRTAEELLVVHDELDLPFGAVRLKEGGGDGGHNGLRSVTGSLGGGGYARVRVGIGLPPGVGAGPRGDVSGWVLGRFSSEEQRTVGTLLERAAECVITALTAGPAEAQRRFNVRDGG